MRVDLHNHTYLCNHATGTPEQYIQTAFDKEIDIFGFSEHAPMNGFDEKYRLKTKDMKLYESMIKELQSKYQERIKILLSYEVDFLQGNYLQKEILNAKVDYLIGSVHFLNNNKDIWGFDNPEFIGHYKNIDINKIWEDYFEAVTAMINTNYFNIVGHLDLLKVFNYLPTKDIKLLACDTIKAIKKANMVLEVNSAGLRKPVKQQYPSKQLLELAFEYDIPITFSSDAHSVEQVGFGYESCLELAKEIGYTKCCYFENKEQISKDL
jgi:histidinol-phosphatase (PHP family)